MPSDAVINNQFSVRHTDTLVSVIIRSRHDYERIERSNVKHTCKRLIMNPLFNQISPFYQTPNTNLNHTPTGQHHSIPPKKNKVKPATCTYTKRRTDHKKIDHVLAVIVKMRWTLGEFLHKLFIEPDKESASDGLSKNSKAKACRSDSHRHVVANFLSGSTVYSPCDICGLRGRHS